MGAAGSSNEIARAAEALIGTELDGRYRIDALLGAGGMGAVFRGHHRFLDEPVAIKVLRPHLGRDPAAARRFVREARGTHKVASEHAVKVIDFAATDDGLMYLVLELLAGRTVADELHDDGPLAPRRAVRIARQVCDALAAAHRVGLIHRDLKPENLMLIRRQADPDFVKVLDFGLVKVMEHAGDQALSMAALTQGGVVFGTPDYMAPEQALGNPLDGRADLYALGATLFEMLTGQPPFPRPSPLAVLAAHVREPAPRLADVAPERPVPEALEAVVAACLAKDPAARPPTAEALAAALTAAEAALVGGAAPATRGAATASMPAIASRTAPAPTGSMSDDDLAPPPSRRAGWLLAIGGIALAVAAAGVIATRGQARRSPSRPSVAAAPIDAGPTLDAAPVIDAAIAVDAGAAPRPAPDRVTPHLDAAQAAQRAGNRLRQLAEADAALRAAPSNRTARYLVGDALVASGDLTAGCRYLRSARLPAATARARAVGCP